MTEAEEHYEEIGAQESDTSNSESGDADNTDEPNFDEPTFDDLPNDVNHGIGMQFLAQINPYPNLGTLTLR